MPPLSADGQHADTSRGKKIILIDQNFVSPEQSGNSRSWSIVSHLARAGWQVEIIAPRVGYLGEIDAATAVSGQPSTTEPGPHMHRLDLGRSGVTPQDRIGATIEFTWRAFRHALSLQEPTVVYGSTAPSPPVLAAMALSVCRGAPMLLEISDLWPLWLVEAGSLKSTLARLVLEFVEAIFYRYAHHVVAVGPTFPPYLAHFGVEGSRLSLVVSGLESWIYPLESGMVTAWRRAEGLEGRRLAVYAGSFNDAYGISPLLDAAARTRVAHPDLLWLFAGNGRFLEAIREAQNQGQPVRYLGNLSRENLRLALAAMDFGIISLIDRPLLATALSGKVFDYMAAGLPILATTDGITAEFVRQARCGVVANSATGAGIAAAASVLLALPPEQLTLMGATGRRWGLDHVDAGFFAERVAASFETLASEKRPGFLRNLLRFLRAAGLSLVDVARRRATHAATHAFNRPWSDYVEEPLAQWGREIQSRQIRPPEPAHFKTDTELH